MAVPAPAGSRAEACSQAAAVDNLGNIFGLMVPDASPAGKTRRHPMTKPPSIQRLKPQSSARPYRPPVKLVPP